MSSASRSSQSKSRNKQASSSSHVQSSDSSPSAAAAGPADQKRNPKPKVNAFVYVHEEKTPVALLCAICEQPLVDPVAVHCQGFHRYCHACILSHKNASTQQKRPFLCPNCGVAPKQEEFYVFARNHPADVMVFQQLDDLHVFCFNQSDGCKWTGPRGNIQSHLDSCAHYVCAKHGDGCNFRDRRAAVEAHAALCPYVEVDCSFKANGCASRVRRSALAQHEAECKIGAVVRERERQRQLEDERRAAEAAIAQANLARREAAQRKQREAEEHDQAEQKARIARAKEKINRGVGVVDKVLTLRVSNQAFEVLSLTLIQREPDSVLALLAKSAVSDDTKSIYLNRQAKLYPLIFEWLTSGSINSTVPAELYCQLQDEAEFLELPGLVRHLAPFQCRLLRGDVTKRLMQERQQQVRQVWQRCDLRGLDLSGLSFGECVMHGCGFSGATLMHTDLSGADLSGSSFVGCDLHTTRLSQHLSRCDFTGADLSSARLAKANVTGCVWDGAQLAGADLSECKFELGCDLSVCASVANARFQRCDLRGVVLLAKLNGVDFTGATLAGQNFSASTLTGANLSQCDLSSVVMSSALRDVNFTGANLGQHDLTRLELSGATFVGADLRRAVLPPQLSHLQLQGANLSRRDLSGRNLSNHDFSGADLSGANLSRCSLRGANFSNCNLQQTVLPPELRDITLSSADLSGLDLSERNLSSCVLQGANLTRCNLQRAQLPVSMAQANFTSANLSGLDLSGKDLSECNLEGANLSACKLQRANLSRANLRQAQVPQDILSCDASLEGAVFSSPFVGAGSAIMDGRFFQSLVSVDPRFANARVTLLYQGTRDGRESSAFHSRCDNKGPTLTVVRCNANVFGGFTSQPWSQHGNYCNDSSAFLFSLLNPHGVSACKLSVSSAQHAIYNLSSYGPTFGNAHDLYIANGWSNSCSANVGTAYHAPPNFQGDPKTFLTGANKFTPDEVEVFSVVFQ